MTAAIWPFDWITEFKDALPPTVISERQFPKVYGWISRFRAAVKAARQSAPKPKSIQGSDALKHLISTGFAESEGKVDDNDPTSLRQGSTVEVWPIDTGTSHRDRGRLLRLDAGQVSIATETKAEGVEVHVHFPRWGFRVAEARAGSGEKL